jgi:hypothetical protein
MDGDFAGDHGIEPTRHQLPPTVQVPEGSKPTTGELAARLCQHHSAVVLVELRTGDDDRSEVWVRLIPPGRAALRRLAVAHRDELESFGPALARALGSVLRHPAKASAQ